MSRKTIIALWLCVISFIFLRYSVTKSPVRTESIPIHSIVEITGYPEPKYNKTYHSISVKYLLSESQQLKNIHHLTNLKLSTNNNNIKYGDLIEVQGLLTPYNTLLAFKIEPIVNRPNLIVNNLYKARQRAESIIINALPMDQAAIALGMTLGSEIPISLEVENSLKKNGTIHMLVASGSNIAIIVTVIVSLSGHIHRKFAIILAIVGVLLFVGINGFQPPAIRASLMAITALSAQFFGRYSSKSYIFLSSIALYLLIQPQVIYNVSFQLSLAATAGIIYLSPLMLAIFKDKSIKLLNEISITLSAQIAVLPLIYQYFKDISYISVIANIFVSWTIPFIMVGTILSIIFGLVNSAAAKISSFFILPFTAYFLQTNKWLAIVEDQIEPVIKSNSAVILLVSGTFVLIMAFIAIHKIYSNKAVNHNKPN